MEKYSDVVLNRRGEPVSGASVTVYVTGTNSLAYLYSDYAGTVSVSNPVTTDGSGRFSFYAVNGRYDLTVTGTGIITQSVTDIQLNEGTTVVGPASATDNAIARFDGTTGKLVQNSSVTVDDSGNTGLATSISSWGGAYRALQIGFSPYVVGNNGISVAGNLYQDGLSARRITAGFASRFSQWDGVFRFYVAGYDIGGSAITETQVVALDENGIDFSGKSGQRFKADFSNATLADRFAFQTSTASSGTSLGVIPNGSDNAAFNAFANQDPTNTSFAQLRVGTGTGDVRLTSGVTGTGTYLPMTFHTGGSERVRINTSGTVSITTPINGGLMISDGTSTGIMYASAQDTNSIVFGTTTNVPLVLFQGNAVAARIDTNKNFTVVSGAFGYGAGAGGTVTQATSRTTGVTLNKPSGQITLFSATTTAGTFSSFTLTNSFIAATDSVIVSFSSGATADRYGLLVTSVSAGSCRIQIHNVAAVGVAEAPVINFAVIKGSTT